MGVGRRRAIDRGHQARCPRDRSQSQGLGQGVDMGSQYISIVFYHNQEQKK
ncbi:peptide-methionine (S)-S-oxide reductase [Salegentibacter sp. JZCK2]|nr:peptide-methionine (S)-S-oxide reductase [Salegentibacter tibetensis]MBZ9731429.1 peptide-methionine (S)-S-oxide reductase [Salegentibacter tibetensis]